MIIYAMLFLAESIFLYIYYYGLGQHEIWLQKVGSSYVFGLMLNVVGMTIMVLGNSGNIHDGAVRR